MPRRTVPTTQCPIPPALLEAAALWYRGGYTTTQGANGYVLEYNPFHPRANRKGLVYQHRLVAERALGHLLSPHEVVHHRNEKRRDNRPENLEVMPRGHHQRQHTIARMRKHAKRYDPETVARVLAAAPNPTIRTNDLGLSPMTVAAICKLHGADWISCGNYRLTEERVREALRGRTTLEAARYLGVSHQALRYKFDHLLTKRKSPTPRRPAGSGE